MYNVLIPVDKDINRALHQAKYVARLSNTVAEVKATVLHVVPPSEFATVDEVEFSENDSAVHAAEYLEEGLNVNRIVDNGRISKKISNTADELDIDEIVIGGRKRGGVTQVLLGSTAQDVLLSAQQAVTITGENTIFGDGSRRVLVPVDRDGERALHQAKYVAGLPGAAKNIEVTVLYVFPHQDYTGAPAHDFDEIEAAVDVAAYLEEGDIPTERVATGGEVAREILHHAEERDVDSIVMGGRKRSGIQKVLLGSTTQDIMLSTERPVTITG